MTSDFALYLALFGVLRILSAFWFTPRYSEFTDFHYPFAQLSDYGLYPFVHYWLEYPPLFPYLSVGIYRLLALAWPAGGPEHFQAYGLALQGTMALFDVGSAVFLYRIVARQADKVRAGFAGGAFCLTFLASFAGAGFFDGMALFFILWCLDAFLEERPYPAGLALGLGFATKLFPLALLPALIKFRRSSGEAARLVLAALIAAGLFWGSFFAVNSELAVMPLKANAIRQPWETVWALLEGHYGIGYLGWQLAPGQPAPEVPAAAVEAVKRMESTRSSGLSPVHRMRVLSRFSTDLSAFPGSTRGGLYLLAGLIFLALFAATWSGLPTKDARRAVPYGGYLLLLFLLYSKGWSPQFSIVPAALLLAVYPTPGGAGALLAWTAIHFVEMPLWLYTFSVTDRGPAVLQAVVAARTLFLAVLAWSFYRGARQK
ncbi:MAG: hypothetical protein HYU36_21655 [Planctomycetes bacterium]|nr:hypothetical protein [Planctomycetota bacterium]